MLCYKCYVDLKENNNISFEIVPIVQDLGTIAGGGAPDAHAHMIKSGKYPPHGQGLCEMIEFVMLLHITLQKH